MAVGLKQSTSGASADPNPQITLPAVSAGSALVLAVCAQGIVPLGLPTDNQGNQWQSMITGSNSDKNMAYGIFYAFNVPVGNVVINCPGMPSCVWAAHEFTGVQTSPDPGDTAGLASTTDTTVTIPYLFTTKGELVFGAAFSSKAISFGLPAGVTVVQTQETSYGSISTSWTTSSGSNRTGTFTFTTPTASDMAVAYMTLL